MYFTMPPLGSSGGSHLIWMADTDNGRAWTLRGEDGPEMDESFHSFEKSGLLEELFFIVGVLLTLLCYSFKNQLLSENFSYLETC